MSKTFTVTTTELEDKALRWAERDPQLWLETLIHHRAKSAMTELYSIELKKALADPLIPSISSNMEEVVLASTELTAKEKTEQAAREIIAPALDASPEELAASAAKMAQLTSPQFVADTPRTFLGGNL
jgi:hypothetical protein